MKDMGSCEIFPQIIQHNCNGRFLVICGDGEYIIYTSQALRNKAFGQALDFAWSAVGTGDFAIRESLSRIKIFKNFKEELTVKPPMSAPEGIFGGACLAVRGADCVCFFDWNMGTFICKIDVAPTAIYWNETQEMVLLVCEDQGFVLKYIKDLVDKAVSEGSVAPEVGVPGAFEPEHEISGTIEKGQWIGDCFIFSNGHGRLSYFVGGNTMTLCHLDQQGTGPLFMLGYLPREDRVYFMDRSRNVVSYRVLLSVLQYQTAVVRCDFDAANAILPAIPESEHSSIARFLEAQGHKDVALQVSKDKDHRFDLALELGKLNEATILLDETPCHSQDTTDSMTKWKRLGDLALSSCDIPLAERCAQNAKDLAGLLMLYTASGNRAGVSTLAHDALNQGKFNVAFVSYFILGQVEECYELLVKTNRVPEAALFARTFLPSHISSAVALWRKDLKQVSERAAAALADPSEYPNLFPDLDCALKVEEIFKQNRGKLVSASAYQSAKDDLDLDLISLMKSQHATAASDAGFASSANHTKSTRPTKECASTDSINSEPVLTSVSSKDDIKDGIEADEYKSVLKGKQKGPGNEADAILNDDFGDDDDW
mmetsp:Transcript_30894/g.95593  ORF Transcript_30894/g.95593 Transcript_30894/m.95593 type:complete len:598 (+) Transcript_30894:1151-2944(+)